MTVNGVRNSWVIFVKNLLRTVSMWRMIFCVLDFMRTTYSKIAITVTVSSKMKIPANKMIFLVRCSIR